MGDTIDELLEAYPSIVKEDILACLDYAATLAEELQPIPRTLKPIFGNAKGLVEIDPDFDDPKGFED